MLPDLCRNGAICSKVHGLSGLWGLVCFGSVGFTGLRCSSLGFCLRVASGSG